MKHRLFYIPILFGLVLLLPIMTDSKHHKHDKHDKKKKHHKHCHDKKKKHTKKRYDYIIVGLGSAGSILARKLTDDMTTSVLVLETGENRQTDPVILNPNWFANANELTYSPKYAATYPVVVGTLAAAVYSEGEGVWGGSAAHNFLVAVRGTPNIYNAWAAMTGNNRWLYTNVLPMMKALEMYTPDGTVANPVERGFSGPISVTQNPPIAGDTFLNALSTVTGTPFVSDYNDPSLGDIGIAADQQFITAGAGSHRSYSDLEFLPVGSIVDAEGNGLNGRKLKIVSNARALKFRINSAKRATSVVYVFTGSTDAVHKVSLKKNTGTLILSAGAVRTPKILLNSGVGPAADLTAVGIPVIVDSPNVGKNLQCGYGASGLVTGPITNLSEAYIDGFPYMPADGVRRIQILNSNFGTAFQPLSMLLDPQSRGSVDIVDNDPLIDLQVNYPVYSDGSFTTPGTDAYLVVSFFKIIKQAAIDAGQIVLYPPAQDYPAPFGPAPDDSLLFADAQALTHLVIQSHIVGTTRMGTSIANGVVDGNLSVFGLENVKIGDIGIEPIAVNGNTCYSAYVIALVLADILGVPTPPAL